MVFDGDREKQRTYRIAQQFAEAKFIELRKRLANAYSTLTARETMGDGGGSGGVDDDSSKRSSSENICIATETATTDSFLLWPI